MRGFNLPHEFDDTPVDYLYYGPWSAYMYVSGVWDIPKLAKAVSANYITMDDAKWAVVYKRTVYDVEQARRKREQEAAQAKADDTMRYYYGYTEAEMRDFWKRHDGNNDAEASKYYDGTPYGWINVDKIPVNPYTGYYWWCVHLMNIKHKERGEELVPERPVENQPTPQPINPNTSVAGSNAPNV